jgi:hypothetical protein
MGRGSVFPVLADVCTTLACRAVGSGGPQQAVVEAHRSRSLEPTALVFLRRHAGCAMKCSRKAGLRGELGIECYLRERQFARSQFSHRVLHPNAAYVAVRRDTHGESELTRKMEWAVTRDSSEIYQREVILDVCCDIVENTAEPSMVELMCGGVDRRACAAIAMFLKQSGRKRQRGRFDVYATRGRLDVELGED